MVLKKTCVPCRREAYFGARMIQIWILGAKAVAGLGQNYSKIHSYLIRLIPLAVQTENGTKMVPNVAFLQAPCTFSSKMVLPCRRDALFGGIIEPNRSNLAALGRGDPYVKELFPHADAPDERRKHSSGNVGPKCCRQLVKAEFCDFQYQMITTTRTDTMYGTYVFQGHGLSLWTICGKFLWRCTSLGNVRREADDHHDTERQWRPLPPASRSSRKNLEPGFFPDDTSLAQTGHVQWATADRRHDEGALVFVSPLAWLSNCTGERGWDGCEPAPCIDVATTRYSPNHVAPTLTSNDVWRDRHGVCGESQEPFFHVSIILTDGFDTWLTTVSIVSAPKSECASYDTQMAPKWHPNVDEGPSRGRRDGRSRRGGCLDLPWGPFWSWKCNQNWYTLWSQILQMWLSCRPRARFH